MDRPITIKELKIYLEDFEDDLPIMVAKDKAGTQYLNLSSIQGGNIGLSKSLELKYINKTEELSASGKKEEDFDKDATPCVILWPD